MIIRCSKIGTAMTVLSQLSGVTNKREFVVRLINGFGGQLHQDWRDNFAKQVKKSMKF